MTQSHPNDCRAKFPSFTVKPINNIDEAIARGHYTPLDPTVYGTFFVPVTYCPSPYRNIRNKNTHQTIKLPRAKGDKRVYVVSFNRTIGETEYVELLAEHGLKPCKNGPSYLAGLMAQVPEAKIPRGLQHQNIVAAEPKNPASIFKDNNGDCCFLYVSRGGLLYFRELALVHISRSRHKWSDRWAFLAEEKIGIISSFLSTLKGLLTKLTNRK